MRNPQCESFRSSVLRRPHGWFDFSFYPDRDEPLVAYSANLCEVIFPSLTVRLEVLIRFCAQSFHLPL